MKSEEKSKKSSFTLHDEDYIENREAAEKAYREALRDGKTDITPEDWQIWQDLQDDIK